MTAFKVSEPYAPRKTSFDGLREHNGWRLRLYSVLYEDRPLNPTAFAEGEALALAALPQPAIATARPGAGFLIRHQGRGMNYAVIAWWDRENELPIRVFVDENEGWRPASGNESICVWDIEIIAAERNAFVSHVLAKPEAPDLAAYFKSVSSAVSK